MKRQEFVRVKVLFAYEKQEERELKLKRGEILLMHKKDPSGWALGHKEKDPSHKGWFPADYVTQINENESGSNVPEEEKKSVEEDLSASSGEEAEEVETKSKVDDFLESTKNSKKKEDKHKTKNEKRSKRTCTEVKKSSRKGSGQKRSMTVSTKKSKEKDNRKPSSDRDQKEQQDQKEQKPQASKESEGEHIKRKKKTLNWELRRTKAMLSEEMEKSAAYLQRIEKLETSLADLKMSLGLTMDRSKETKGNVLEEFDLQLDTTVRTGPLSYSDVKDEEIARGWLHKKGRRRTNWKKRWFVLKGSSLYYYNKTTDNKPLGEIDLEACHVDDYKIREGSARPCNALLVEGRKLLFYAETDKHNISWYIRFVSKNAELAYIRKVTLSSQQPVMKLIYFLHHPFVKVLDLSNLGLFSLEAMGALSQVIRKHPALESLLLSGDDIKDLALVSLCEALESNERITHLDLSFNCITSDGAKSLAKCLKTNKCITSLNLSHNKIKDSGTSAISGVLGEHKDLHALNLSFNEITDKGVKSLTTALSRPHSMPKLQLGNNKITDDGAINVALLLKNNDSITSLNMEQNEIGELGLAALCKAAALSQKLTEICVKGNRFTLDILYRVMDLLKVP
eukprot:TRINITY_DN2409_c0_g1_i1.p1 TRINITY_DN2409_c0_g1~~TRINITY_DN2409_c0_g1_i1.p1  ORF type:complete len:623 (-),score=121.70 TRINITY_DN2409_c0_g1_i1:67-1935(-)